jgi:hypothetical protein
MAITKKSSKFEGSYAGAALAAVGLGACLAAGNRGGNYLIDKGKQAWNKLSETLEDQPSVTVTDNKGNSTTITANS